MPDLATLVPDAPRFRTHADVIPLLFEACAAHPDVAEIREIGRSEEGRPLVGITLGRGPIRVSLIAGNHADEPVGPETLRTLATGLLRDRERFTSLLERYTLCIVPHANPDGEARNQPWIERWPDAAAFIEHVQREPPGRDLEFGFPDLRPENRAVADFLRPHAPFHLHMSLHGMAFSEGAMLLVERQWAGRTRELREAFAAAARADGLGLHDHNRQGEKGFFYIAPGFTTTPEGAAMRAHFDALGQPEMSARFRDSSMEFVRSLGGDPLSLVTELPLFLVPGDSSAGCGEAPAYERLRGALAEMRIRLMAGDTGLLDAWALRPLPLTGAMRLQMRTIDLGLARVRA